MEHRYSQRWQASIPVIIHSDGMPIAVGKAGDISKMGMYINVRQIDKDLNNSIEVEVRDQSRKNHENFCFHALIVHKDAHGIGVTVDENDTQAIRFLYSLMNRGVSEKRYA